MRRVIVTGAQGLLGRQLTAALLDAGVEAVLGIGRSPRDDTRFTHDLEWLGRRVPAPVPAPLRAAAADPRYAYASLDLRDRRAVAAAGGEFGPDVVIHAAAALRDAPWDELLAANVEATVATVEGLASAQVRRLVLVSSGSVYGAGRGRLPLEEEGPTEPLEPYGATKRAGEDAARIAAAAAGVELVVARVFNLVGPGLQDRHLPGALASRVSAIARGLAAPELRLGPLTATRDFVDVRDTAAALLLLAEADAPPAVVNVASGAETAAQHVLDLLLEIAQRPDVRVVPVPGRRADVPRSYAAIDRLERMGFRPAHDLRGTLAGMLAYFDDFAGH